MTRYAITIFLSAFLLFQVQPIIGKFILPWFGGSPAVWTTCMLFFQVFLLGGYAYAHLVSGRLPPRLLIAVHWALLAGSLARLPIAPDAAVWKQTADDVPIAQILALLGRDDWSALFSAGVDRAVAARGLPPRDGRTPYRLYSLSNAGSLLGLVELSVRIRAAIGVAHANRRMVVVLCALRDVVRLVHAGLYAGARSEAPRRERRPAPTAWQAAAKTRAFATCCSGWRCPPAARSMLLATTNQLCQEVPSVPFLVGAAAGVVSDDVHHLL